VGCPAIELGINSMQSGVSLSSRDYYLTVALGAVRSVELEVMNFFNCLSAVGYRRVLNVLQPGAVQSVEMEVMNFFNSPSAVGYMRVLDVLHHDTDVTIVRKIIGQTAMPHCMEDFDNVISPRLNNAVATWKTHCIPFGTAELVTDRTVLQQWMEESIQNLSSIAIRSMQLAEKDPANFQPNSTYMQKSFNDYFPHIHAWQLLHER
jgi:hypothetical protein